MTEPTTTQPAGYAEAYAYFYARYGGTRGGAATRRLARFFARRDAIAEAHHFAVAK